MFAGGEVEQKLKVIGTTAGSAHPARRCVPIPIRSTSIRRTCRCRSSSGCCAPRRCCLPGVKVTLHVEKGKDVKAKTWSYPEGLKAYLEELAEGSCAGRADLCRRDLSRQAEGWRHVRRRRRRGVGDRLVRGGRRCGRELRQPDSYGGRGHPRGRHARRAVRRGESVRRPSRPAAARRATADRGRVGEGCTSCLSARILDPQFQGQVKEKLTSRDALKLVAQVIRDPLEVWLNSHVDYGKRIAELAIQQALTRMKSAQKVEKKKGFRRRRAAREADRLRVRRRLAARGVPGRRRFGRRFGEARARQAVPGDPAAARQGAQHVRGGPRPAVREQRDPRHRRGDRRRSASHGRRRPTSRACAIRRSSSWRTRTSTAVTSRCCC